ncbi:MAG: hypothetical protein AAGH72_12995 [Verrucomicrobiota bacterium]
MKYGLMLLALVYGMIPAGHACGLNWAKPTNHFDGVNPRGYLSHWENWGSIQINDELTIPFIVGFRSNRESTSPYLGKGWTAALLESYAVPVDERRYRVMMPDGYNFKFWKDRQNPQSNIYHGSRGWKAQRSEDGSKFTAWAPCGTKIEWQDGKIREITTKGGNRVRYIYQGGLLTRLEDGQGKELVEVNWLQPGVAKDFVMHQPDGKELEIEVEQDKKPEIQQVAGTSMVGELTSSLSRVSWHQDGKEQRLRNYVFQINTDQMLPTLEILENDEVERSLVWNPQTRYIMQDGEWKYQIQPGDNEDWRCP